LFSIIPGPWFALAVPFIPGMHYAWEPTSSPTIPAEDIVGCDIKSAVVRMIRGVYMPVDEGSLTGLDINPDSNLGWRGGYFDTKLPGTILIQKAPSYLQHLPGGLSVWDKQGAGGIATANAADHPGVGTRGDYSSITPQKYAKAAGGILNEFARAIYITEVLRNRSGSISCPFRLDIGPGSNISFESPEFGYAYGQVISVAYSLTTGDSEQCGVTYQLNFVRTAAENQNPAMSIDYHPLYKNYYIGGYFT